MNDSLTQDPLELKVTDFGPVVKATVDLRPLTVFVGPSNTGKSYLAILIYALHRFFGDAADPVFDYFFRNYRIRGWETRESPDPTVDALGEVVRVLVGIQEQPDQQGFALPSPIADLIRSGFDEGRDALGREICRCFGIDDVGALTRQGGKKGTRIELYRRVSNDSARFEHRLKLLGQAIESQTTIPEQLPVRIRTESLDEMNALLRRVNLEDLEGWGFRQRSAEIATWRLLRFFGAHVLPCLTGPLHLPAYYLPADRTGIMHAHSVVVSALIASAPTAGLRPSVRTPMLSGVLADFLEQLIEVDRRRPRRRTEDDLGTSIEESILSGSVRVVRSPAAIRYPSFTYRPHGWKSDLPLMNASSMVSELAPVVLYLRHMVRPGNVLIIEEPESHLHPAMQVKLTRQLAVLVGAGVRVIVTTHSEWLLEELANIVRRSELPESRRGDRDVALRPEQVGAWLFEPKGRPKGSVVRKIDLDESGLYPAGFDDVAAALHNDWAELSGRIKAES